MRDPQIKEQARAVINVDDRYGHRLIERFSFPKRLPRSARRLRLSCD